MAPNLPKTFKAAVAEEKNALLVIKQVPLELPKKGEVLIKVKACGVCHSDQMLIDGSFGDMPRIPGHEVIGTVVAVGPEENRWKEGDIVGGPWHGGHDGICKPCNRGFYQMCENEEVNGMTRNGGYADYCLLRTEATVRIPNDVDPIAYAPLLCAGVTVFNGIRQMNIAPGSVVAIQGLGGLGHLAVQYSRKMGYRTVALSSSDSKRDFALELGANDYVDGSREDTAAALQKLGGAALIVVTAPNPEIVGPLINGLDIRGKLLLLSPVGEVPVNTLPMIMKGLSVHGWPSGHAIDSEDAINFAQHHGVSCLVEKYPLDKANEAIERMLSGKARFRVVLTMD